ncbi:leucine-rich_repeat domain-containing protein [Hexamita inflata]|uniref:Leucine-rich_repeat domain-containing protein n=1 Tax=Hexamita inflata TaxID=28002 RepID=A0ABP1GSL1_9EUKA
MLPANVTKTNEKIQSLSEYNYFVIQKYYPRVKNGSLKINSDKELKSLDFIQFLNIDKLIISCCKNIFPKLESKTIKQLELMDCNVFSVQDCILQSLEVLELSNYSRKEADTLVFEIVNFQKLKRLTLYQWITNISPLSQITRLTKLCLIECEIRSIEALKSLVNLEELSLSCSQSIDISNKGVDITSIQYLTKLTKLSLRQCNLVALDALRPLMKLEELYIYYNNVVYLQPLAELNQLSKLDA